MNTSNHRNSRADREGIISETMENKDPAINQHEDDSFKRDTYDTDHALNSDNSHKQNLDDNDDIDPDFKKHHNLDQDMEEHLKNNNDPNRRTLDEYSANEAEPDEEEEEE